MASGSRVWVEEEPHCWGFEGSAAPDPAPAPVEGFLHGLGLVFHGRVPWNTKTREGKQRSKIKEKILDGSANNNKVLDTQHNKPHNKKT